MPFKGCLSDACVLMKIERFVLKPLRKTERFVLKQWTFRFADYTSAYTNLISFVYRCFFNTRITESTPVYERTPLGNFITAST